MVTRAPAGSAALGARLAVAHGTSGPSCWAPASETPAYRDALDHDADDEEASETFKLMFTDSLYYATVLKPHLVG